MRTRLNVALYVHGLFCFMLAAQTQTTHETSPLFVLLDPALQNLALTFSAVLFYDTNPNNGPLSSYTKSCRFSQLLPLCKRP